MSSSAAEYMEFLLVDPRHIPRRGLDGATVMTIGALYHGQFTTDDRGTMRQRVNLLNSMISDLAHLKKDRRTVQKKSGHQPWQPYYCSLCGGKFDLQGCKRCAVSFTIDETEVKGLGFPNIPPKVVQYATAHGHKFARRPPRP